MQKIYIYIRVIKWFTFTYFHFLTQSLRKDFLFFHIKTILQYGKYMNQQTKHCCIEIHVSYKMLCEFCTHTTQMQNI